MARQEKSLAVCLEILQDYTAKDFSLFAVLTTADFYSHNSQFHFLSHNPNDMRKSVSFCRLQANRSKETPFLDLPYHFVCILHRKKEVIDVNLNDHFHAWLHSLGENPMQEAWTSHSLLSPEFLCWLCHSCVRFPFS